jgi:hypothetical protein
VILRKVLWAALNAATLLLARKLAIRVWKVATGEEPPVQR